MIASRFLVPALLTALVLPAVASAQSKVAVANPVRIFSELDETKDLKQKLENERRTLAATEKDKQEKIQSLESQRNALKPDAPQWADKNREWQNAVIEYQVWSQVVQADFQRSQKTQMRVLFGKIEDGVRAVATSRGYDIVISDQRPEFPENLDQINLDQLRQLINQRNVLFNKPEVDITAEVIAQMNQKYKSGQ
jgi:Skp family chaperone for outer membrane proteins